jgi:general secretion pathway protein A
LERILLRSDLRQLRQRIAVYARLEPFTLDETAEYIAFRLEKAGCPNSTKLFSRAALSHIWNASKGSPRSINVLCDHALVNAFARGLKQVQAPAAQEAVQDVLCIRKVRKPAKKPTPYLVADFGPSRESSAESDESAAMAQKPGGQHE